MVKFVTANSQISKQNRIYPVYFPWSHRPKRSNERVVSMKICHRFVIFGPGKLEKGSLKVLEKSWIFFKVMVYEPCLVILAGLLTHNVPQNLSTVFI